MENNETYRLELAKKKLGWDRDKLINDIDCLIETLQRESERMKRDSGYLPNSLGIIQRAGQDIDNMCGRLYGENEIIDTLGNNYL